MSGGGGGNEENYWPGFVDALSNVVLTLIFVLVVFVFALSMAAHKVEQRAQEVKEAEARQQQTNTSSSTATQENEQLKQQLQQAQETIKQLQAKKSSESSETAIQQQNTNTVMTANNTPTKPITGKVGLKQASTGDIQVYYPNAVADADEKSMADLNHALAGAAHKVAHQKVLVLSYLGQEPYSAAMRLAYYRAITIRNLLINQGLADSTTITTKIMPSTKAEPGHVEIIYQ